MAIYQGLPYPDDDQQDDLSNPRRQRDASRGPNKMPLEWQMLALPDDDQQDDSSNPRRQRDASRGQNKMPALADP